MIPIVVQKEDQPYAEDYEAWLTGWLVHEGRVMAMVTESGDGYVYMIPQYRVRVKV